VAWADPPSDPASNDSGIGAGGVPQKAGDFFDSQTPSLNPSPGDPVASGSIYKAIAKGDGNVPDGVGVFVNNFWQVYGIEIHYDPTAPGLATKIFTPGCSHGHAATEDGTANAGPVCH
jgi:hypothetical protein